MSEHLTHQSRKALALANDAARSFNHGYVGTEHVLLGLIEEGSGGAQDVLTLLGVGGSQVRAEIERLVHRGRQPVPSRMLPLTPRAQRAIDHAKSEARSVNERCVTPEQLLLGLMREPDGVAGQVLRNLGVAPDTLRAEVLRVRLAQMKIVERAVRPVRAGTPHKRKMREELLAHLAAIYDEEQARMHDPAAALQAAGRRFGNPGELAAELEMSLPPYERFNHFIERFVGYRAPESAARFCLRMAVNTFVLLAVVLSLVTVGVFLRFGWIDTVQSMTRVFAAIVLLTPPALFVAWLAYIKMRDALWGAFGSPKSAVRVFMYDMLIGFVAAFYLMAVAAVARMDLGAALESAPLCGLAYLVSAFWFVLYAYLSGPNEIRDTHWALLDLETA